MKIQLKNNQYKILFLILIFSLILRLYFFVGVNWDDDIEYVGNAYHAIKNNFFIHPYPPTLRSMMTYVTALNFLVFGINDYSATLYPLLSSLGSIILIFYFGKRFFNIETGLLAAFFLSLFPLEVMYSTFAMPDVPMAFFIAASFYLFLNAGKRKGYFLLSGILLGLAYLTKETAIMAFLFFVPIIVYQTFKQRKLNFKFSFFFLGFLTIFILESFYFYYEAGDFLYRYKAIESYFNYEKSAQEHGLNRDFFYYPLNMLNLDANFKFDFLKKYFVLYGLFYYFVIIAAIVLLARRRKESYIFIFWLLILFLYLNFGSTSLSHYYIIHRQLRHLTPLTIPALLLLSYFLVREVRSKFLITIVILFLSLTSVYYIYHSHAILQASTYDMKEIYNFLKETVKNGKRIYTDGGAIGHLLFQSNYSWEGKLIPLGQNTNCEELKGNYLIVNATRGWIEYNPMISSFPKCVTKPANNWVKVKTIDGPKVDIYARFNPEIYFIR